MPTHRQPMIATRFCLGCGYPLEKLGEPKCPECGNGFDPEDEKTFRFVAKRPRSAVLGWVVLGVVVFLYLAVTRLGSGGGATGVDLPATWFDVAVLCIAALLLLFGIIAIDAHYVRKDYARREQLLLELSAEQLRDWHFRCMRSWRPLLLLSRLMYRGALPYNFAVDLTDLGLYDEALPWVERAIAKGSRKVAAEARRLRAMILLNVGHIDDPRVLAALQPDPALPQQSRIDLRAWAAVCHGQLEEAVELVRRMPEETYALEVDTSRGFAAMALLMMGRYEEALTYVEEPLVDGAALVKPRLRKWAATNVQLAKDVDRTRQWYARLVEARQGPLAVFALIVLGRLDEAQARLVRMQRAIEARPRWRATWEGLRAWLGAKRGQAEVARAHLAAMDDAARRLPGPLDQLGPGVLAARCHLELNESAEAKRRLEAALPLAVTPVQRHEVHFLLGCAEEAMGQREAAKAWFEKVAAEGIESVMGTQAAERVSAMRG